MALKTADIGLGKQTRQKDVGITAICLHTIELNPILVETSARRKVDSSEAKCSVFGLPKSSNGKKITIYSTDLYSSYRPQSK
jgi:hypothetical protein